jgi:hypothetical protein
MNNKELFMKLLMENTNVNTDTNTNTNTDTDTDTNANKERCLISDELLDNNYITLMCNHKFNFLELYNEVVEQKTKKLLDNSKLKLNEIKCPYCRTINNKIMPYFKYYENKLVKGVNSPSDLSIQLYECTYIDKSLNKCGKNACITKYGIFCNNHLKYTISEERLLTTIDPDIMKMYKKKTIVELKNELRMHNNKLTGNKEELINRLIINLNHLK